MRIFILMVLLAVGSSSVAAEKAGTETVPGNVFRDCADCPVMVIIPSGSFEMGSTGSYLDEMSLHRVNINYSFALGRTEVTQGQWRAVMGNHPSDSKYCGDDCPVESVTRQEVLEFIRKLNAKTGKQYRLPTEAEWEYACRAGKKQEYCGSDNLDSVAWYSTETSERGPHPVGRKQANAWGLYDMSGNVWELVEDNYLKDPASPPADGSAQQGNGMTGVVRGGSWATAPKKTTLVKRGGRDSLNQDDDVGFRLARVLGAPSTEPASYAPSAIPVYVLPNKLTTQTESVANKIKALTELYKEEGTISQKDFEARTQAILKSK
jgi:formylglycine-generating enzyme required for sulfatase activity